MQCVSHIVLLAVHDKCNITDERRLKSARHFVSLVVFDDYSMKKKRKKEKLYGFRFNVAFNSNCYLIDGNPEEGGHGGQEQKRRKDEKSISK